jgi:hypothetical protein
LTAQGHPCRIFATAIERRTSLWRRRVPALVNKRAGMLVRLETCRLAGVDPAAADCGATRPAHYLIQRLRRTGRTYWVVGFGFGGCPDDSPGQGREVALTAQRRTRRGHYRGPAAWSSVFELATLGKDSYGSGASRERRCPAGRERLRLLDGRPAFGEAPASAVHQSASARLPLPAAGHGEPLPG